MAWCAWHKEAQDPCPHCEASKEEARKEAALLGCVLAEDYELLKAEVGKCNETIRLLETKIRDGNLKDREYLAALEEIVCMQHMHEGRGGCHGPCPVCLASTRLGLDKYLRNPGDKERVQELQKKHDYPVTVGRTSSDLYFCNKCGYSGPDRIHKTGGGSTCVYEAAPVA